MSMMQTYKNITYRDGEGKSAISGFEFLLKEECENDYYKEELPSIPAGTTIVADFAGDFGMYGIAEVNGVIHKVKVPLRDLHKINFGPFEGRQDIAA